EALRKLYKLKQAFTTASVLSHYNPSLPNIVDADASYYSLGAVPSQKPDAGKHPIAFDSGKRLPENFNYEINDKELLGIVWALKCCRSFLLSLFSLFEVLTDHSTLQYFMSSQISNCCQAGWAGFLSKFHFSISDRPGQLATLPDALSSCDNVYPERGKEFMSKNPINYQQIIKQDEIRA
ncbi:hypothetical protein O181_098349, partial [Austropuccinia psidii MF-1]|nr:hypothetical protein [Austropuccinia psidii MF-1]